MSVNNGCDLKTWTRTRPKSVTVRSNYRTLLARECMSCNCAINVLN